MDHEPSRTPVCSNPNGYVLGTDPGCHCKTFFPFSLRIFQHTPGTYQNDPQPRVYGSEFLSLGGLGIQIHGVCETGVCWGSLGISPRLGILQHSTHFFWGGPGPLFGLINAPLELFVYIQGGPLPVISGVMGPQ